MFRSAAIKLTAWYLAIIMALSIGLSLALYNVSSHDIDDSLRRQNDYYNFLTPQDLRSLNRQRLYQLNDSNHHLRNRLVVFNLFVLFVGGAISYLLARRTLQPIEEALDTQTRFAGDAAHELRTPLTAMQAENEVTLRDPKLNKDKARRQLESNLEEVAKLRALSDGLLALVADRDDDEYKTKVNLAKIVTQAISGVKAAAKAKQIKIDDQVSESTLYGNHAQLVNLVSILLDNAIKYSPSDSQISVTSRLVGKAARLEVADQGIGIKPSEVKKIFERFYRADNSRSKLRAEGYGLGLAIAKQIVERHRGYIEVKSRTGQGTIFSVVLPQAKN